jgi:TolB-like protein
MRIKGIGVFCFFLFIPMVVFSQVVTLDNALRNSTTYLNGRIQARSKVVVLNFTSDWPRLSDYIIDELIGYVVNDGNLTVVDRNNLETIRKELNFQFSGEVSDETAQSIGKMLGAQIIINGNITAIGSSYRLRIRAISVESAQIIGMNNVDVAQDSRIAALTGTASAGPVAVATTPATPVNTISNGTFITPSLWRPGEFPSPGTTIRNFTGREVISGQERDVLTVEVTFTRQTQAGGTGKWGNVLVNDESVLSKLKTASGVRFKAMGDGKGWIVQLHTTEARADNCFYQADVKTQNNRVVDINLPFSSFKQPSWGKKVPFVKNNIMTITLQRHTETASETGPSTMKVFDFEVY